MSALYQRHISLLTRQAFRLCGDWAQVDDIVAEALSSILRTLQKGRGPQHSFVGYALISLRAAHLRISQDNVRQRQTVSTESGLIRNSDPDHADRFADIDKVARAFRKLPPSWQTVLNHLLIREQTIKETATEMNISEQALRALSFRAREGLRTAYLEQAVTGGGPGCLNIPSKLPIYLRNKLRIEDRERIHTHLSGCAACASQFTRLHGLNLQMKALTQVSSGPGKLAVLAKNIAGNSAPRGFAKDVPRGSSESATNTYRFQAVLYVLTIGSEAALQYEQMP